MNSDKHGQRGNAMIYILLALALLGGLTMILARQNDDESSDLSRERTELLTTRTVAFVGSAKQVVDQMMMSGTNINSLSFVRPNQSSFDTAPHMNKVFHPDGGGLNLDNPDPVLFTGSDAMPKPGWYMGRFNNVQWTPTGANDIILAAYGISEDVCKMVNFKITGSTTIPVLPGDSENFFVDTFYSGAPNQNLTTTECAACNGYPSLCVAGVGNVDFTYYNIISGQ